MKPDLSSPRALAQLITRVERGGADAQAVMRALGPREPASWIIGVTGPPGSGKSTLVDRLTAKARSEDKTVGIVAVDPTSPFSGGAILGDRVRMLGHSADAGVFVRSMAARRSLGGLASATRDVVRLLNAYGFDLVILETVGVGQAELDVVSVADTVAVVCVPGLGDAIQTMKAGILEIADVFVVNMADRAGVERTVADLKAMLTLDSHRGWTPPIVETVAVQDIGVAELWSALVRHRTCAESSGELDSRRRGRRESEVIDLVERELRQRLRQRLAGRNELAQLLEDARAGTIEPHAAAARIIALEFPREK